MAPEPCPDRLGDDAPGPLPLTAFLVVLPSKRGVRKGAAFVFGWLVSLGIVVTVTVVATGNNFWPNTAPVTRRPGG